MVSNSGIKFRARKTLGFKIFSNDWLYPLLASLIISAISGVVVGNFILGLLIGLFVFLWSLLLVVPGIVKTYPYSMAYFIKCDHPEYSATQAIDESSRIMHGNKMKLLALDLSFIGWWILGSICFGIGTLWVVPYVKTAHAEFYLDLLEENEEQVVMPDDNVYGFIDYD